MKANELRIGNLVHPDAHSSDYISVCTKDFENTAHLDPIPLTEEWLLRFGFSQITHELDSNKNYYYNSQEYWIQEHTDVNAFICYGTNNSLGIIVENVNQLQNLYFALTGEELI